MNSAWLYICVPLDLMAVSSLVTAALLISTIKGKWTSKERFLIGFFLPAATLIVASLNAMLLGHVQAAEYLGLSANIVIPANLAYIVLTRRKGRRLLAS